MNSSFSKTPLVLIVFLSTLWASCRKETIDNVTGDNAYGDKIWVVSEGAFMQGNASVDVLDTGGSTVVDAFFQANGYPLGDVLQSVNRSGEDAYLVVNGSEKIEIVSQNTMRSKGILTGVSYPRYTYAPGNGKIYITGGSMQGNVSVFELSGYSKIADITIGFGPEKMCMADNKLWVVNSGGWSIDETVSVIDIGSDQELERILVGERPVDLVVDEANHVWVLCSGQILYDLDWNVIGHTAASLHRIDAVNNSLEQSWNIGISGDHPVHLAISPDGSMLYLLNGGLHAFETAAGPESMVLILSGDFKSLDVDPSTGNIWMSEFESFAVSGEVIEYRPDGTLLSAWEAGVGPNAIAFPQQ